MSHREASAKGPWEEASRGDIAGLVGCEDGLEVVDVVGGRVDVAVEAVADPLVSTDIISSSSDAEAFLLVGCSVVWAGRDVGTADFPRGAGFISRVVCRCYKPSVSIYPTSDTMHAAYLGR